MHCVASPGPLNAREEQQAGELTENMGKWGCHTIRIYIINNFCTIQSQTATHMYTGHYVSQAELSSADN